MLTLYSKLVESIPKHIVKEEFDDVLKEVANYQEPKMRSSGKKGQFSLKPECWAEFEGRNFSYYATDELQEALTRYQEYVKKNPNKRLFIKVV